MPHFFFHLSDSEFPVVDDEGASLADERSATSHALQCAREVIASDILAGLPVRLSSYIQIVDDAGIEHGKVYFHEAVTFSRDEET